MTVMMPADQSTGRKRVLLGMSGGVDSSVAAFLLQQQGWDVFGLSLLTNDHVLGSLEDARAISSQLGIAWEIADVREEFLREIIDEFVTAYAGGRTPNPCVICNPLIKFAHLYAAADRLGCQAVATGHYADVRQIPATGRYALAKTEAGLKDQTYFMYRLSQDQLSRLVFPLAGMAKPDVRAIAAINGLSGKVGNLLAEKPDSQDCCFIPDGDYATYIEQSLKNLAIQIEGDPTKPGTVINMSGQPVGTHKGLIHYTLGQRKGFQVQTTERLFVLARDAHSNTLTVGPYEQVLREVIWVVDPVYSGLESIQNGERLEARIRNSAKEAPCTVSPEADGSLRVVFDQPVSAPAPGQSCVFYRDGLIMAGGFIGNSMRQA